MVDGCCEIKVAAADSDRPAMVTLDLGGRFLARLMAIAAPILYIFDQSL